MEKYGEIPPKFTKKWWEYFWYYYKWHTIITVTALIIALVTIVQCANREKYDMNIVYAGHMNYGDEEISRARALFSQYVTDIDKDGKQSVFFQTLMFSDGAGNEEYDYAMQTKLDFTFTDDCTFIYLMDEIEAALYINRDSVSDTFEKTELYAPDTDARVITAEDGNSYAVNLKDSDLLKTNGIYCDNLYLLVRSNNRDDEKNIQAHEDALKLAKELIK